MFSPLAMKESTLTISCFCLVSMALKLLWMFVNCRFQENRAFQKNHFLQYLIVPVWNISIFRN